MLIASFQCLTHLVLENVIIRASTIRACSEMFIYTKTYSGKRGVRTSSRDNAATFTSDAGLDTSLKVLRGKEISDQILKFAFE